MSEGSLVISFEADPATAQFVKIGLAQNGSGSQVTFRGHDELPIGVAPARSAVRSPDGPPQICSVAIQSERDLIAVSEALRRYKVEGWVMVATSAGPERVELSKYMQQIGLTSNV